MELRQLKHFVALAEAKNFHEAAESVGLTQSALTQSIAKLERHAGVNLFIRSKTGSVLTQHGERLYEHAQVILAQVKAAETELSARASGLGMELTFGVVPSLSDTILLDLLERVRANNRGHSIKLVKDWSANLLPLLERGIIDFAFMSDHLVVEPDHEISREVLLQDEVQVVVGRSHPLYTEKKVSLAQLSEFEWVAVSIEPAWSEFLVRVFAAADVSPPHRIIQTNSVTLAVELIGQGYSIGLVSAKMLCTLSDYRYKFFDVPQLRQQRIFSLCYRSRMVLHPFHRQFVHAFKDLIKRTFS